MTPSRKVTLLTRLLTRLRVTAGKKGAFKCPHRFVEIFKDADDSYRVVCPDCDREWS